MKHLYFFVYVNNKPTLFCRFQSETDEGYEAFVINGCWVLVLSKDLKSAKVQGTRTAVENFEIKSMPAYVVRRLNRYHDEYSEAFLWAEKHFKLKKPVQTLRLMCLGLTYFIEDFGADLSESVKFFKHRREDREVCRTPRPYNYDEIPF